VHCTYPIKREVESTRPGRWWLGLDTANYYTRSCDRSTTVATADAATLLNTHVLCSNQIHQITNTSSESEGFPPCLGHSLPWLSHHSTNPSPAIGERWCQPHWRKHLNLTSRLKGQPTKRWSLDSALCEHRAHVSWLSRPSHGQIRSYNRSQINILHLLGARTFKSSFAPSIVYWPGKSAW
jgi:hypothetical protein